MSLRLVVALVLVAALFAGCATSSSDSTTSEANFNDFKGTANEQTGLIRGVVVDPSVTPITKATVTISGPSKQNTTTDSQGRFLVQNLVPGTYIVRAKAPLFLESQTTAEVVANVAEPKVTRITLEHQFSQKPYIQRELKHGYFDCSQYGAGLYSSSNCVTDQCPIFLPPDQCNGLPTSMMDNITTQQREWHLDVGPGWQNLIFEMQWDASTPATSKELHMTVSTYKPLRDPSHWFAEGASPSPFLLRLDVGVKNPTASGVEPTMIPPEGMDRVSYFVSSAPDTSGPDGGQILPSIALQQKFDVYYTVFYYGIAPAGWSFLGGSPDPF